MKLRCAELFDRRKFEKFFFDPSKDCLICVRVMQLYANSVPFGGLCAKNGEDEVGLACCSKREDNFYLFVSKLI